MLFSQVLGQSSVVNDLLASINGGRYPHALMLLGNEGCGKLSLALALSQYLLCENPSPTDSCGRCAACLKASKFIHPDLHFSFPTIGTNVKSDQFLVQWRTMLQENPYASSYEWLQRIGAENKQGNINKEECLNIVRKLSLKTFESSRKVLLMWQPEYLGKEGNRLLKLIEEPPENTFFILVAEQSELILNTILSRCQITKMLPLKDEEIAAALQQRGIDTDKSMTLARLSNGNFNVALQLLEKNENDNATLFLEWMRKCYKGNMIELVQWVNRFAGIGRENQKFFLHYALHFMREYLFYSTTNDIQNVRLSEVEKTTATNFRKIIGFHQIEKMVGLLDQLIFHVERNANPKILFLDASLNMNRFLKEKVEG
ncbi:MAG: hypothetical protein AAF849_00400 [Bacteroidota bacterium]